MNCCSEIRLPVFSGCGPEPVKPALILYKYYSRNKKNYCLDQYGNKWIVETVDGIHKITKP